jgi:hypothetical protein
MFFEAIGDPRAGPSLPGDLHDVGRIGLLEPGRRIKFDRAGIIGGVTDGADHTQTEWTSSEMESRQVVCPDRSLRQPRDAQTLSLRTEPFAVYSCIMHIHRRKNGKKSAPAMQATRG